MTIRGFAFASAISATTACSAFGLGKLVMTTGTAVTSSFTLSETETPAFVISLRRFGSVSTPATIHPSAIRLRAKAPPMMPRPIMPTMPFDPAAT